MQGLDETGGAKMPKSIRLATRTSTLKQRYARTLAGIAAPAVVAAMVTGMLFGERMPKPQSEMALADRVNMLRAAQGKHDMLPGAADETLTSALEQPTQESHRLVR